MTVIQQPRLSTFVERNSIAFVLARVTKSPVMSARMRLILRVTLLSLAAGLMIFWCSCERHHPEELMPAQDTAHAEGAKPDEHGSPSAKRTPPQFFPTPTASPQ
jgi:hypothetical protein